MQNFNPPKGTRDFYPADAAKRAHIFRAWDRVARRFGFEEYDGPLFEHLELFTRKSGDEIVKQLYNFKDKGDREIALRPELTPTLARMVAARAPELRKPIKWYAHPQMFRYERTQKGRTREFYQFNMDILGAATLAADAELIAAAHAVMIELGCKPENFRIRLNSRDLVAAVITALGIPAEKHGPVYAILDKRLKVKPEALAQMYQEAGIPQVQELESIFSTGTYQEFKEKFPDNPAVAEATGKLAELFSLLEQHGCAQTVVFDFSVVRGLAYYTGLVWEVFDTGLNQRAVAGGGRYDNLIRDMGGEAMPAAGFGMGDVVIGDMLEDYKLIQEYKRAVDFYIVGLEGCPLADIIKTAARLRAKNYSVEYGYKDASVSKQMQHANAAGAGRAVFVGGEEAQAGKVKVKDLGTGREDVVTLDNLLGE